MAASVGENCIIVMNTRTRKTLMTFDLPENEDTTNIMRILLSKSSKTLYILYQADIGRHRLTVKDIRSRKTTDLDLSACLHAYSAAHCNLGENYSDPSEPRHDRKLERLPDTRGRPRSGQKRAGSARLTCWSSRHCTSRW